MRASHTTPVIANGATRTQRAAPGPVCSGLAKDGWPQARRRKEEDIFVVPLEALGTT